MQLQSKKKLKTPGASVALRTAVSKACFEQLELGRLLFEKCELKAAQVVYLNALKHAKKSKDIRGTMEAISGLLRLASEANDSEAVQRWDGELEQVMAAYPKHIPPMAWFCKGVIARYQKKLQLAQRCHHRALRSYRVLLKTDASYEADYVRCWQNLATVLFFRGHYRRALWLFQELLRRYESKNLRAVNGSLFIMMGLHFERLRDLDAAQKWYQKAHASFLGEHHWYNHIYVLYGYARVARLQKNYVQAYWYLDLMDKAASGDEFSLIKEDIRLEKNLLENDAIDLLIDSRRATVKTRESAQVSLGKQYVLLNILEALTTAHGKVNEPDSERGLSKAEIIEKVWKESYRPESHDNKLYYNINRLRKLLEPDMKAPQYLLNWKEGYRLAPGLKVHLVGNNKMLGKGKL